MLSVILTYQKVMLLTSRYAWFILFLTLTTRLIESCSFVRGPKPHHDPQLAFLEMTIPLAGMVLGAANDAALLGLLREPIRANWKLAWDCACHYTWVLFRLNLLIAFVALLALSPFALLFRLLPWASITSIAIAALYLVLIKFSLAYPLAVDERLNARQALKRSWEMTRGHFWYVVGCYRLMASVHFTVGQLFRAQWLDPRESFSASFFIKHAVEGFFDSLWIILGWQMYADIKNADAPPASEPSL